MDVRIWLVTRDRWTWIAAAEILALAVLLIAAIESTAAQLLGLVVLGHLGYSALTGLPIGEIPGRPEGGQERRNLGLRAEVATFLREVRRVDEYAERAQVAGWPADQIEANLRAGEQRLMAVAAKVAKATRRAAEEEAPVARA